MASMRTIGVRLRLLVGDYKRDAKDGGAATDELGEKIERAGKKSKLNLDKIATGAGIAGAALLGMAGLAEHASMVFDKQMSEVGAVAGATSAELDQLRDAAIKAGAATVFSATDAAKAEAELAKAGISTADILSGALNGSLALASAGSIDLADSAELAAAAMNTFGLEGKDVSHVADVLSAAANKSAAGVEDLGLGLQQVGLVAAQNNLTLEDTVGVLAAMADRGLRGSDAGTSLKTALQRLAAPTDKARATMDELGISMYDANGQIVDIATVAGQLQGALTALAPAQRNAALQTIFGSDAIRTGNVLYAEGETGIRDYIRAVNDQGAASRVAAAKLDNLAGDVEQLKGSLETLFITSGSGASGGLRLLAKEATALTNTFSSLPGPVQSGAVVLAGITGVGLLAAAAAIKLKTKLADVVGELEKMGPAGTRAAHGLEATSKWAARLTLVLAGLQIAGQITSSIIQDDLNPQIDALAESLIQFGRSGQLAGEGARVIGDDMGDLGRALNGVANAGVSRVLDQISDAVLNLAGFDSPIDQAKEKIAALDAALAQLVASGHSDEAAAAFKRIWEEAQRQGIALDRLQAAFPTYIKAAQDAELAAAKQGDAAKKTAQQNIALAGAFGAAAAEADGLTDAFDHLNGSMLTWRDAERDAEAAVDDLQDALKASHGSLDTHERKGRDAAAAVDALAKAAAKAAQANYDETGSVEAAKAVYDGYIGQLRSLLLAAGHSKKEVDDLVSSIAAMPASKVVTIDVITRNIQDYRSYRAGERRRWGGLTEHAATGLLTQAAIYSPPTRYAFAEPATGGEAFVPRRGDYGRSMGILSAAAGWYNADVLPRGGWYGGAGSSTTVVHEHHVTIDGTGVLKGLRKSIRLGGGDVQSHIGPADRATGRTSRG